MGKASFRYGGGQYDIRAAFVRLCGGLQRKKTVILNSNPQNFGQILAASDVKGTFIEHIFANPAWDPIYSVESVDGELWEELAKNCRMVIAQIKWRERLSPILLRNMDILAQQAESSPQFVIHSEAISRLTLRTMYELVFESQISEEDELLFYQASLEWRKEIAIKGKGELRIKAAFWERLADIVNRSAFGDKLREYDADPGRWLSAFAQPFLISPQINVSDVMVAVFHFLRATPVQLSNAREWAASQDKAHLNGVVMEAIRLQHPFPVLERELQKDFKSKDLELKAGTQVFLMLDQLQQSQKFNPERWVENLSTNPYSSIPFGAGHRMCIGKPIAQELLIDLLQHLLNRFKDEQIRPQEGHLYSGRDNDHHKSWRESLYQAKVFGLALFSSYRIGRQRSLEPRTCPFSRSSRTQAVPKPN